MTDNIELPQLIEDTFKTSSGSWADEDDVDVEKLLSNLAASKPREPYVSDAAPARGAASHQHRDYVRHSDAPQTSRRRRSSADYGYGYGAPRYDRHESFGSHNNYQDNYHSRPFHSDNDRFHGGDSFYTHNAAPAVQAPPFAAQHEAAPAKPRANPFGNAKPVDQSKIEAEINKKLEKMTVNGSTYRLGDSHASTRAKKEKQQQQQAKEKPKHDPATSAWETRSLLSKIDEQNRQNRPAAADAPAAESAAKSKSGAQKAPEPAPVAILKREGSGAAKVKVKPAQAAPAAPKSGASKRGAAEKSVSPKSGGRDRKSASPKSPPAQKPQETAESKPARTRKSRKRSSGSGRKKSGSKADKSPEASGEATPSIPETASVDAPAPAPDSSGSPTVDSAAEASSTSKGRRRSRGRRSRKRSAEKPAFKNQSYVREATQEE